MEKEEESERGDLSFLKSKKEDKKKENKTQIPASSWEDKTKNARTGLEAWLETVSQW